MRLHTLWIASSLFLAGIVAAQHPAPTRIETAPYGMSDGISAVLELECYLKGPGNPAIRLSGGDTGSAAYLMMAVAPADVRLPWDGILRVDPHAVTVAGVFDGRGIFEMPVSVANDAYCGFTVYFQGAQVGVDCDFVELSHGLEMTFHDGTVQPDFINYTGPVVTSILCKERDWVAPPEYGLLVSLAPMDAPYPGWDLCFERIVTEGEVTKVFMTMNPIDLTQHDAFPADEPKLHCFVDLGIDVEANVAVFVGWPPIVDRPKDYALAAWIDAVYPDD